MRDGAARWLWDASRGQRGRVMALALCQVAHAGCGVAYALVLRGVVDAAVAGDAPGFARWVAAAALVTAAQLALRAVARWLEELARASLENALKLRLLAAILRGDVGRAEAVHSGEWMGRLTGDARVAADGVAEVVPGAAGMVVRLLGSVAAVVWLDPRLGAALVPAGAAALLLTLAFRRRMRALHRNVQRADGKLRAYLQDRLGGLVALWSLAGEDEALAGAAVRAGRHLDARMRRNRYSNVCNVMYGTAMSVLRVGAVAWCGWGIVTGSLSLGTLTATVQLVGQVQAPLAYLSGYLPRWQATLGSAERLAEAEGLAAEERRPAPLSDILRIYRRDLAALGLDSVAYVYWQATTEVAGPAKDDAPPAVEGLSLEVRRGESVALVGPSGCGKSTALRLLMGAYTPDAGEAYLGLADGSRLAPGGSLRRLFAYVPQGNQLMGDTVREAVALGDPGAADDDGRLWEALRVSCADGFVRGLEGGLDAPLGERGSGLSEGQAQRLAVARAVFSGAPVLLLDEATSALDAATEGRMLRSLRDLPGRTVVVAAHRPSAIAACDRAINLDGEGCHGQCAG